MDLTFNQTTGIGLGYASHVDAFQRGREAAQMAKNQLQSGPMDLVLAFGPPGLHFQDFIEGVRLVTGEETLVGIPSNRVILSDLHSADAALVLIFQSPTARFSVASADAQDEDYLMGVTSIFSQLRSMRGSAPRAFDHHGVLAFDTFRATHTAAARELCAVAGLESWLVASGLKLPSNSALVCRNKKITGGLVAIECLSSDPWEIGTVNIGAFLNQPDIHRRALSSAIRDAAGHMKRGKPCLGLVFFDFSSDFLSHDDIWDIFESSKHAVMNLALVELPLANLFLRSVNRSISLPKDSITAILVPQ